jgi:hypothetical protein
VAGLTNILILQFRRIYCSGFKSWNLDLIAGADASEQEPMLGFEGFDKRLAFWAQITQITAPTYV